MPHVFWVSDMCGVVISKGRTVLEYLQTETGKVFKQSDVNEKEIHFSFNFWGMIIG